MSRTPEKQRAISSAYYDKYIRGGEGEVNADNPMSELGRLARRTKAETGKIMGISRQAVHQLERKALWKLRQALAQDWADYKGSPAQEQNGGAR